jgi:hypothetical protein
LGLESSNLNMKKTTSYIGVILIIVFFSVTILFAGQKTGYIKIDPPGFETDLVLHNRTAILFGKKSLSIRGDKPAEIRAGSYKPERIILRKTENSDTWWSLVSRRGNLWGELAKIDVAEGQTTVLKLGPPLTIRTEVRQKQRSASISVLLIGRSGEHWNPQVLTSKGRRKAKLKIIDETGNVLTEGPCQYG